MSSASAEPTKTRVAILGAGPIGLELAVELRRAGIPFEIIDAGPIGQTMTWWAPQTRWFSSNERIAIAGVPLETVDQSKATREQYLAYLRSVARQFDIRVRSYEKAVAVDRKGRGFRLGTVAAGQPRAIDCDRVVLAVGGSDRPQTLGIPGEDLPHVDGYLREPHRYFGRRVLIVGGRNSAVESALRLHHAGAQVAISYRRSELPSDSIKYWLRPEIEGLIRSGRIAAHFGTVAREIKPGSVILERSREGEDEAVESRGNAKGGRESIEVPADDVLSLIGYVQDKTLFRQAGIDLVGQAEQPRFDESTMETNVPGIYVAGTAVAGTQSSRYKIFVENCHVHVHRIVEQLRGMETAAPERPPEATSPLAREIEAMPES